MSATMKAAVVHAFGQPLVLEEVPVPTPGPGQVLVRVIASGVCHTDLHAADGDASPTPALPFIPGHEVVGDVVVLGPGATGVAIGDRVGVPWLHDACGRCELCETGRESLCPAQHDTGFSVAGGYAEYVVADAAFVARIPRTIDPALAAPVLCAGLTSYKGLRETEARPGQWVVVSGIGGLGHLGVQYAHALGLRVVAVDVSAERLALARRLGAELTVLASDADAVAFVRREVGGAHGALVTADSAAACRQAIGMLRAGGTCVLVGLPPGDVALPVVPMVRDRLTVRGSIGGTRADLREALDFAARGAIEAACETRPLAEVNEVFAGLRAGTITGRVVFDFRPALPYGPPAEQAEASGPRAGGALTAVG